MLPWEAVGLSLDAWCQLPAKVRLSLAAARFLGWRYRLTNPRTPFAWGSTPTKLVSTEDKHTNCSTMTAALIMVVYPDVSWTLREYGDLQVFADRLPALPDAPIVAAVRVDIGRGIEPEAALPGDLCLVQGWRDGKRSGHAFMVHVREAGALDVLAASSTADIGPRWQTKVWKTLREDYTDSLYAARLTP